MFYYIFFIKVVISLKLSSELSKTILMCIRKEQKLDLKKLKLIDH